MDLLIVMNWTWSNGDVCERSPRIQKQHQQQQQQQIDQMAQQQSLLSENDMWSLEESVYQQQQQQQIEKPLNKREDTYNKISEREMVGQMGRNPFMLDNNYINDVMIQENFLKPISTTGDREKSQNLE